MIAVPRSRAAACAAHAGVTPCVVNLLDQKLHNPNPDYFSYTLAKAALAHATVLLAQALAPAVRVCGVSPGITLVSGRNFAATDRGETPFVAIVNETMAKRYWPGGSPIGKRVRLSAESSPWREVIGRALAALGALPTQA